MCDLINNHTDGGENWTAKRCYVEKKGEIIIKGKKQTLCLWKYPDHFYKRSHFPQWKYLFFKRFYTHL